MSKISLFVASSGNFNYDNSMLAENDKNDATILKRIIEGVTSRYKGSDSIEITTWWNEPEFTCAGSIRDTIIRIAHKYDIGIFVLENDKKNVGSTSHPHTPNSNVYIEYGLFLSLNKYCYIIRRDNNTTLPSDISNEQAPVLCDEEKIVTGILKTIEKYKKEKKEYDSSKGNKRYDNAQIFFNAELSKLYMGIHAKAEERQAFISYETKALFIGSKSAYLWKRIEQNAKDYVEHGVVEKFVGDENEWDKIDSPIARFEDIQIDNIVSLGPGIGSIDRALIAPLRGRRKKFFYIPVDINPLLAIASLEEIHDNIAFAVVDDFEDYNFFSRLKELLYSKKTEIGKNNLFSMLGVTFSNLSTKGNLLFNNIKNIMEDKNDYFLLDVIIYDKKDGGYMSNSEIEEITRNQISKLYKDLIINAMKRKGFKGDINTLSYPVDNYTPNSKYTMVRDTKIAKVLCRQKTKDGQLENTLLIAKYYKYEKIKKCLKANFNIVASAKYTESRRGIFLLQKKDNH